MWFSLREAPLAKDKNAHRIIDRRLCGTGRRLSERARYLRADEFVFVVPRSRMPRDKDPDVRGRGHCRSRVDTDSQRCFVSVCESATSAAVVSRGNVPGSLRESDRSPVAPLTDLYSIASEVIVQREMAGELTGVQCLRNRIRSFPS